ncbi:MAG: AAA family ATPase [Gemmatimonadetes bacterium]|nr:AAA family ATPase [Gemmatimonadota bacterium]
MAENAEDEAREVDDNPADDAHIDDADSGEFYWKQSRENLFTPSGVRMFQLAYPHRDEEYEQAREAIDAAYEKLSPRLQSKGRGALRKGGSFINHIAALQEFGLMYVEEKDGTRILRSTPAGDQAAVLLEQVPNLLRTIPYYLIELLSRYPLNNPQNHPPRNPDLARSISESNVFPYWTIYRLMRALDNRITKDELARFVFRLKKKEDIPATISSIQKYRKDVLADAPLETLDDRYGLPLTGAIGQPKYIMGRAGVQTGVIDQDGDDYALNKSYIPFLDQVLATEPAVRELDEDTWVREYGEPVEATEEMYLPFERESEEATESTIPETDPIFQEVRALLEEDGFAGVVLVGPPGTGKTWYARQIALRLVAGDPKRIREVQFHPSYQYEDFVEGFTSDGRGGFTIENRHLLVMAMRAANTGGPHVMLIDELSRTDPARVMGEALTYMETTLRGQRFFLQSGRAMSIPNNLLFLATMNPEDRSVDEIDGALDRRWGKVYLNPDRTVLDGFLQANSVSGELRGAILKFFVSVQSDYALGHAFFRNVRDVPSLRRLWKNQLQHVFNRAFRYDKEGVVSRQHRRTDLTMPPCQRRDILGNPRTRVSQSRHRCRDSGHYEYSAFRPLARR